MTETNSDLCVIAKLIPSIIISKITYLSFFKPTLQSTFIGDASYLFKAVCTINNFGFDSFSEFIIVSFSPVYSLNLEEYVLTM